MQNNERTKQNFHESTADGSAETLMVTDLVVKLIDAQTNKVIGRIRDGDDIPASVYDNKQITMMVEASDPAFANQIASVRMTLGNHTQIENVPPYALFGDNLGDYNDGDDLGFGNYTLKIEAFSGENASGRKLTTQDTSFEVTGSSKGGVGAAPNPKPNKDDSGKSETAPKVDMDDSNRIAADGSAETLMVTDLVVKLIDAQTNKVIGRIRDGDDIPASVYDNKQITMMVEASDPAFANQIASVRMTLGNHTQIENVPPYALFGDNLGDYNDGDDLGSGNYTLKIEAFSGENASGSKLTTQNTRFEVTGGSKGGVGPAPNPKPNKDDSGKSETAPKVDMDDSNRIAADGSAETLMVTDLVVKLIDAQTNKVIGRIRDGDDIPASVYDNKQITMMVEASDPAFANQIASVRMTLGNHTQIENVPPYALFGDNLGDYNDGDDLGSGNYTLKIEAFSGENASGSKLTTQNTRFEVTGGSKGGVGPAPNPKPVSETKKVDNVEKDVFEGKDGLLVMEAENGKASGDWQRKKIDGETVMLWDAKSSSYTKVPTGQQISFQFEMDETGSYHIALRSARDKSVMGRSDRYENNGEERFDTGNDVYVRVINLDSGNTIQQPTKLFTYLGDKNKQLAWGDRFDNNHKESPAEIALSADTKYQIEIIGRSDGYALDKVTINKGGALKNNFATESSRIDGVAKEYSSSNDLRKLEYNFNPIATKNDFEGANIWVMQDVGRWDIDNPASAAALILGAKNIAAENDKLKLVGAFVDDTCLFTHRSPVKAVEDAFVKAGSRYDVDVYSTRSEVDVGAESSALREAMINSIDQAHANDEQLIIVAGGPSEFALNTLLDWVKSGSLDQQVNKAIWVLEGGFAQVTHGSAYRDNGVLDGSRTMPTIAAHNYKNCSDLDASDFGLMNSHMHAYEQLFDVAEASIGTVFDHNEFNKLSENFVGDSLLFVLEDQNQNKDVVGPTDLIKDTIADDLALEFALEFAKKHGSEIDVSDVGLLGMLLDDGAGIFDSNDMRRYLTDDFVV